VVGKTNVPAFGSAAYTKNLAFGTTRNCWNPNRTSGGSSGGSAVAVASRVYKEIYWFEKRLMIDA